MHEFADILATWYRKNLRDLPWRHTKDPFRIWLSEISLQQTRVDQGLAYYHKFVDTFPDIRSLAEAPEDQVLRLWQGLGYYSRARNLHAAAKQLMDLHDGKFPADYNAIRNLKGIGDYTAAAISSFAFGLPYPVVDGNVYRFLSRFAGIETSIDSNAGKKEFTELATALLSQSDPATHNQAIMEFGATVCTPKNPDCRSCPFAFSCYALNNDAISRLPVKKNKIAVRPRYFTYFIISDGDRYLIHRRDQKDIWQGLYEFPLAETDSLIHEDELISHPVLLNLTGHFTVKHFSEIIRHQLSHQTIHCRFVHVDVDTLPVVENYQSVTADEAELLAMPQIIVKYLDNYAGFRHLLSAV